RFGIIGCGALGVVHARRLTELPAVSVTAVSDPDTAAMGRTAAALPANAQPPAQFADYRELLQHPDLDAICINSPNPWHVEQLLASLERGLDVLCEKPLTMVPAEVDQVVEATRKSGKTVAIAYQSRYRRDSRILRRALQSGKWGRVTSVNVFSCEDWITPNVGTWRHDPARCPGGFFADANGHQLDLLFWMTGLHATSLRATIEKRGTPVPMVTWGEARLASSGAQTAHAEHPDGIPFTFLFVGDAKHWGEDISIQTEGADFHMRGTKLLWSDGKGPMGPFPESESDPADQEDTPDTAFVTALRGGTPVASPPHTVWPVLTFTLAALESAETGNPVRPQIPPI
ncbi:MAG TPA: Gfo/Idh/MocA family oxidoreductase, partial [Chthonomonadaceae bacterium]|nr:Gfo/Idh/MocA family oxidoreductase [Chthonomonadaceae bacterium]